MSPKVARGARIPEGDWTVMPSRQTFLVPLTLPARVLKRLGETQLRALVFDRIPLPAESSKVWLLVPRLGFFSRGAVTAWAVAAPLFALPDGFDRCLPEDLLLAALLVRGKRLSKGGWLVLDAPGGITLIGVTANAKGIVVWKQLSSPASPPVAQIPESITAVLGPKSSIVRLNAGGSAESLLSKYGTVVTEDAFAALSGGVEYLLRQKDASVYPRLFSTQTGSPAPRPSSVSLGVAGGVPPRLREALVLLALILPILAIWSVRQRNILATDHLLNTMQGGYEKRFGAKIPASLMSNPLLALQDRSRFVSDAGRQTTIGLHAWLSLMDRLSNEAFRAGLQLDVVSLDVVRLEIRGNASDQPAVARWVSGLSADAALADVALVESKMRMSDRRTEFTVRSRLKILTRGTGE